MTLPQDQMSISDWQQETASKLQFTSDVPQLEAIWLIEHVTQLSRTQQIHQASQLLSSQQLQRLNELRSRRIAGEPLAYILGESHFWTLKLEVSPAVLIPRPETELVVERALHHLSTPSMSLLDIGTGSGAIALAVASERPDCSVTACDISAEALAVATSNRDRLRLRNVELQLSNWFDAFRDQRFDVIVSNPPYIADDDPDVQNDVRAHEPHLALFASDHGFAALQIIINQASRHLRDGGWLVLEHGWQQATKVKEMLESQGFDVVASHTDLAGHPRVTEARFFST
jgi:release factor glutamine methyltransferase